MLKIHSFCAKFVLLFGFVHILPVAAGTGSQVYRTASRSVIVVKSSSALGSGVLLQPRLAVTNCHVTGDESFLRVEYLQESTTASVVGRNDRNDVCVLSLSRQLSGTSPVRGVLLPAAVTPGDAVYAIGSPLGLNYSITSGIVSQIRTQGGATVIQFDAAISNGNSGGGLFSEDSFLLGLTSYTVKPAGSEMDSQSLNFAWSLDAFPAPARDVIRTIIANQTRSTVTPSTSAGGLIKPQPERRSIDGTQYSDALRAANARIKNNSLDPDAWISRGKILEAARPGSGLSDFERALALRESYSIALYHAAKSAAASGNTSAYKRYVRTLQGVAPGLVKDLR